MLKNKQKEFKISDGNLAIKILFNASVLELKQWIEARNFSCDINIEVSLCHERFWLTQKERNNSDGKIYGLCMTKEEMEIPYEDRYVIITISFTMSNMRAEEIKDVKLPVTQNLLGESINTWTIKKIFVPKSFPCGVYVKDGFYKAYEALHDLKPNLTPEEFARKGSNDIWDSDLVSLKLYNGSKDCLKMIIEKDYVENGDSTVILSLLMCDIKANLDYIKSILSAFCDD